MRKTSVTVEVEVPVAVCYAYVKNSVENPKFLAAYRDLHRGREFSNRVAEEVENRQLVFQVDAMDSLTRIRFNGWTLTYDFEPVGETKTKVDISIEYGAFFAFVGGWSMIKLQSINHVLFGAQCLLALEHALRISPQVIVDRRI